MKIITEKKEIFGTLQTTFGKFLMLAKHPNKSDVPWYLKDMGVLSFFIVDNDGFGKNILVRGDFIVFPLMSESFVDVHFLIEDEIIKVDSLDR